MGPGKVLRAASAFAVATAVLGGVAAAESAPAATGIIDLRAAGAADAPRAELAGELARRPALRLVEPRLATALVGEPAGKPPLADARSLGDSAMAAYGRLRCEEAGPLAEQAALAFVAAADPADVEGELVPLLEIALMCAHRDGDGPAAQAAADRLRGLGADPPPDLEPVVWSRYPAAPATVTLTVDVDPPGARVFVDLREVGVAPVNVQVAPGVRWVAAAAPGRRRDAQRVTVAPGPAAMAVLALAEVPADPWADVRTRVAGWRAGVPPGADELGALMRATQLELAVVLVRPAAGGADEVALFVVGGDPNAPAREVARTPLFDPTAVGRAAEGVAAGLRAPASAVSPEPPPKKARARSKWVYAAAAAAVVLGAGLVYFSATADQVQRIEIRFP